LFAHKWRRIKKEKASSWAVQTFITNKNFNQSCFAAVDVVRRVSDSVESGLFSWGAARDASCQRIEKQETICRSLGSTRCFAPALWNGVDSIYEHLCGVVC
jgi:hypothetical protein